MQEESTDGGVEITCEKDLGDCAVVDDFIILLANHRDSQERKGKCRDFVPADIKSKIQQWCNQNRTDYPNGLAKHLNMLKPSHPESWWLPLHLRPTSKRAWLGDIDSSNIIDNITRNTHNKRQLVHREGSVSTSTSRSLVDELARRSSMPELDILSRRTICKENKPPEPQRPGEFAQLSSEDKDRLNSVSIGSRSTKASGSTWVKKWQRYMGDRVDQATSLLMHTLDMKHHRIDSLIGFFSSIRKQGASPDKAANHIYYPPKTYSAMYWALAREANDQYDNYWADTEECDRPIRIDWGNDEVPWPCTLAPPCPVRSSTSWSACSLLDHVGRPVRFASSNPTLSFAGFEEAPLACDICRTTNGYWQVGKFT